MVSTLLTPLSCFRSSDLGRVDVAVTSRQTPNHPPTTPSRLTHSSTKSSPQTGSGPVLTLVRATLTWLTAITQKGLGTSFRGSR